MSQNRKPAWMDEYVSVDDRLLSFRRDHPTARIITQILEREPLTFRAEIYLDDNGSGIPNAVGHASVDGGSGNRSQSPTEKTETAAIGRALTVIGYASGEPHDITPSETSEAKPMSQLKEIVRGIGEESHDSLDLSIKAVYDDLVELRENARTINKKLSPLQTLDDAINKRYEVDDGLNSLSIPKKKELLQTLLETRKEQEKAHGVSV